MWWVAMAVWQSADAAGAEVVAWRRDEFGNEVIAGTGGWANGYPSDGWWAQDGYAYSSTDENVGNANVDFGTGSAADNWLIRGNAVQQGRVTVRLIPEDDDTIGLVFANSGRGDFYLAGWTADSAPPPLWSVSRPTLFLIRVSGGTGLVVDSKGFEVRGGDSYDFTIEQNDGEVRVLVDGSMELSFGDGEPILAGRAGLYAYDSGWDGGQWGNTNSVFDSVEVAWFDDDEDEIVDDVDNCEQTANPDQADRDGDGIGDACDAVSPGDPEPEPDDTDPADPEPTDAEPTTDATDVDPTDADPDDAAALDEQLRVGCGCATGAPTGVLVAVVALAAVAARRRR